MSTTIMYVWTLIGHQSDITVNSQYMPDDNMINNDFIVPLPPFNLPREKLYAFTEHRDKSE